MYGIRRRWVAIAFIWLFLLGAWTAPAQARLISSFETEEDIAKWEKTDNVILERSTEHVTQGKYSLKATFLSKKGTEWPSFTLRHPNYPSKDFSKYEYLTMDVYNPKNAPGMNDCIAIVNFIDSQGNVRPGWVPLVAYEGKRSQPKIALFQGIGQLSDKVKFNFSDVAHFSIVMRRPEEDFTVYIDNMRLVRSPGPLEERPQLKEQIVPPSSEEMARFRALDILWLAGEEEEEYEGETRLMLHLDEGKGLPKDSSSYGNDVLANTAAWTPEGKQGSAVYFDGDGDHVDLGSPSSLGEMDALSIEAWIKRSDTGTSDQTIISSWTQCYHFEIINNRLQFHIWTNDTGQVASSRSATTFTDDQWHHVRGTYDGKWVRIYVNGKEEGAPVKASGKIRSMGSARAMIGAAAAWGPGVFFKGAIDEVKISSAVRSSDKKKDLAERFQTFNVLLQNEASFDIGLPSSPAKLKKYDLIVFDNFAVRNLTSAQLKYIREFYDAGGAIAMFGGRNSFAGTGMRSGYKNTPIEDTLPVKLVKPGIYKSASLYLDLEMPNPQHPVVKNLPWIKGFGFNINDGIAEPPDGYAPGIKPRSGAEVLVCDNDRRIPIIIAGERAIAFNLAPRVRNYYFPYEFWEKFIVQAFNHITKDRATNKIVLAGIDLPASLPLDSATVEGKVDVVNLSDNPGSARLELEIEPNTKKTLEFKLGPKETKRIDFSFSVSPLERGTHRIWTRITAPNEDSLSKEFIVEPAFSVENKLPVVVFCKDEETDLGVKVKSISPKAEKLRLAVWLMKGKDKIKEVFKQEIEVASRREEVLRYKFKPAVPEGRYRLSACLYSGDKLYTETVNEIRIIAKSIPFLKRDIDFRVLGGNFVKSNILPLDKLLSLEEDIGLRRSDEFTMEIVGAHMVHIAGEGMNGQFPSTWEDYIAALHKLYQTKIPFTIAPFNFWGSREKYESLIGNMGRMIKLACEIGKEYFVGIRMSEPGAVPSYVLFGEKQTNLEKVDAFVNFISRFRKDMGLPDDKLLFLDISVALPEEWRLACGKNVVVGQAFGPIVPIELSQSALRGMSKSFSQWWEWEITRWPFHPSVQTVQAYFDARTGRPTDTLKDVPSHFFTLSPDGERGFSENIYKMYLVSYYNGAKAINAYSESPYNENQKEAIRKFMEFIRANPRCEEIISPVAAVRSKGSMWNIPWFPGAGGPLSRKDVLKEKDFLSLKTFFPEFSDDAINTKAWWTGTPYGTVDLIYPVMKLEDMKKYNCIIFLSYNRMDSVREDFLDDLMTYVEEGGIVVLSVNQLRTVKEKIEQDKLMPFLGARIEDKYPLPPKKRIKEYIEVTERTPFGLENRRYPVLGQKVRIHKTMLEGAKVAAADSAKNPVLLLNKYGKGYVFLFAVPELSAIPPAGESPFVRDVLDKVSRLRPLPLDISPQKDDVKFLISKTGNKEATIFVMNHGERDWSGDITVNLKSAGLSTKIADNIEAKIGTGYEVKTITPKIKKDKDSLIISGITLSGDREDFTSYRQASFVYIRLQER